MGDTGIFIIIVIFSAAIAYIVNEVQKLPIGG